MKQLIVFSIVSLFFLVYACADKPKDENTISPEVASLLKDFPDITI